MSFDIGRLLSKETISNPSKVTNGVLANEGEYSYVAALNENGFHFCGGSLITPTIVLTAAHCFENVAFANDFVILNNVTVSLGCNDIVNDDCEEIEVINAVLHPLYDLALSVIGGSDLCLLQLAEPSVQAVAQIPSPLVGQEAFTDLPSFEIGWGNELPAFKQFIGSEDLMEADTLVLNNEICGAQNDILFELAFGITNTIDDTMICSVGDSKSVCQGDSGGPLLIQCNGEDSDLIIGATSFGLGCGSPGHPNVFARTFTDDAFNFILDFVGEFGDVNDLQIVEDLATFCQDEPVLAVENPTAFPTVDASLWTCPGEFYAGQDGCDCECGLPDPDCAFDQSAVLNCDPGQICNAQGLCANVNVDDNDENNNNAESDDDNLGLILGVISVLVVLVVVGALVGVYIVTRNKRQEQAVAITN